MIVHRATVQDVNTCEKRRNIKWSLNRTAVKIIWAKQMYFVCMRKSISKNIDLNKNVKFWILFWFVNNVQWSMFKWYNLYIIINNIVFFMIITYDYTVRKITSITLHGAVLKGVSFSPVLVSCPCHLAPLESAPCNLIEQYFFNSVLSITKH